MVAASRSSNADDEHDPEGATIAFERQQVVALLEQARRRLADVEAALARREAGAYGICETCGRPDRARAAGRPARRAHLHRLRPLAAFQQAPPQGDVGSPSWSGEDRVGAPGQPLVVGPGRRPAEGSAPGSRNRPDADVAPESASAASTTAPAVQVVRSTGHRASSG